ncbi:DNA-binding NarL/FixJ family response regulator [Sinomonas atrocyanea]|nr:DNA-binding NarL/FixJ family response regulator [Sinomonas atrocyanea]MDR6622924.1 DNA-binding NarL/FixJ family response regulator [Sinomonas atrocyanea]
MDVFILDDHELVRIGLKDLLEGDGMRVVGESASAREAVRRIPALHPDVAILDGRLGDGTGIEVCRDVRSVDPSIACLILTAHEDKDALRSAVLAGAAGYVLKQVGARDLAKSVRRAAAGETLFTEEERHQAEGGAGDLVDPRMEGLTPQEKRILQHLAQGMTNREIGEAMHLTEKTVKNYVSNILGKLGLGTRTQAAVYMAQADSGHSTG